MKYAREETNKLIEPTDAEFAGIPNWQTHDALMRKNGYLPVSGEAEPREGYTAEPSAWHIEHKTGTRTEPRPVEVDDYEEDPETHERRKSGTHQEWQDTEIEIDLSYIQIDTWRYDPIPEPEPEPAPDTTLRDNAEKAIVNVILALARKYDAVQELAELDNVTIPSLFALATKKGVTGEDMAGLITGITPYKWQLEAVVGLTWAECWQGLKSRFAQWMQELAVAE